MSSLNLAKPCLFIQPPTDFFLGQWPEIFTFTFSQPSRFEPDAYVHVRSAKTCVCRLQVACVEKALDAGEGIIIVCGCTWTSLGDPKVMCSMRFMGSVLVESARKFHVTLLSLSLP